MISVIIFIAILIGLCAYFIINTPKGGGEFISVQPRKQPPYNPELANKDTEVIKVKLVDEDKLFGRTTKQH